jgi:hypothetical protein
VTRVLRLSTAFLRAYRRLGVVPGTPAARAIAATIRELDGDVRLPAESDVEFMMPPSLTGYLRQVRRTGFDLAYAVSETEVVVLTLRVR